MNEHDDQQWLQTVLESVKKRSPETQAALLHALKAADNEAGALLGLELPNIENKRQSQTQIEDSNTDLTVNPLLGTIASQHAEIIDKSSPRRSQKRVCYGKLLRFGSSVQPQKSQKSAKNGRKNCYMFQSLRCPISTSPNLRLFIASCSASIRNPAP